MTEKLFAGTPNKFALIAFLLSLDFGCSVALPHGAVGLSTLCDCGISCSCLLVYFFFLGGGGLSESQINTCAVNRVRGVVGK